MNPTQRKVEFGAVRGIDQGARTIRAYASTKHWDRYGERFEPDAFKDGMADYLANPVVLWAHQYDTPPIGKAVDYAFDETGLILTMEFADTPMAHDVFDLYVGGFLNAFSVGFRPREVGQEERKPGVMGVVYKKAELLENSAVPVPANPGALVMKDGLALIAQRVFAPGVELVLPKLATPAPATDLQKGLEQGLRYVIELAKTVKGGKVSDDALKSLIIQTNNTLRELTYGENVPHVDVAELTQEQADALVKECAVLADMAETDAQRALVQKALAAVEALISPA